MLGPFACTLTLALALPATLVLSLLLVGHQTSLACWRRLLLHNLLGLLDQLLDILFRDGCLLEDLRQDLLDKLLRLLLRILSVGNLRVLSNLLGDLLDELLNRLLPRRFAWRQVLLAGDLAPVVVLAFALTSKLSAPTALEASRARALRFFFKGVSGAA